MDRLLINRLATLIIVVSMGVLVYAKTVEPVAARIHFGAAILFVIGLAILILDYVRSR